MHVNYRSNKRASIYQRTTLITYLDVLYINLASIYFRFNVHYFYKYISYTNRHWGTELKQCDTEPSPMPAITINSELVLFI